MTPQLTAAGCRGLALTVVVSLATGGGAVCAHILTGDTTKTAIVAGLSLACSTLLARLGEGQYDSARAARVSHGDMTAVRPSDIGAPLLLAGRVRPLSDSRLTRD